MVLESGPIVPHACSEDEELTREIVDIMLGPEFQQVINE